MVEEKSGKCTHPSMQNEFIKIMALSILRDIASNIHKGVFYTIMTGQVTDSWNQEQFVSLYKKWSFPFRISSVNVTKSAVSCGFGHIYWRNPEWKTSFLCSVLCLRWVDVDSNSHEEFIDIHVVPNICADTLVACIWDMLIHMNLTLKNCRGQCYDGASDMSGAKSAVAS